MEALLIFFSSFGIILAVLWLIICGIVNLTACGIAFVQFVKEDIKEHEIDKTR